MARKAMHIVLSLFLMVATTGLTFSMHYCGGKWVSTSINKETESCCSDACGCCENKTVHYEVEEDFVSPIALEISPSIELDVVFPLLFAINFEYPSNSYGDVEIIDDTSPPLPVQTRLSLLQTFLC